MADPFITLNGDPGEFLSRADVNVLDADTAHIVQGRGQWNNSGGTDGGVVTPSPTSVFGPNVNRITFNSTPANYGTAAGTRFPLSPGPFVYSFWMEATGVTDEDISLRINPRDSVDGGLGNIVGPFVPLLEGLNQYVLQGVAPALTTQCWLEISFRNVFPIAFVDLSAAMLTQQTADPTFVPSIRIVRDFETEVDAAPDFWVSSANRRNFISRFNNSVPLSSYQLSSSPTNNNLDFSYVNSVGVARNNLSGDISAFLTNDVRAKLKVTADFGADLLRFLVDDIERATAALSGDSGMQVGTEPLNIGQATAAVPFKGPYYSATVRDGIGGPIVYRMDAADALGSVS